MTTDTTWRELYPEGRALVYEGNSPEEFRAEIKAEFGFDPADDFDPGPGLRHLEWGEWFETDRGDRYQVFEFLCPSEHLDAIYGSERWPLGS